MVAGENKDLAGFVAQVKARFPEASRLHAALDKDWRVVGAILCNGPDGSDQYGISAETVVSMIEAGQVQELHTKAQRLIDSRKFYEKWKKMGVAGEVVQ